MHGGDPEPASFARRMAAMLYDAALLFGLFFVLTAIALGLGGGEKIPVGWLRGALLLASYLFFAGFWTHGGQTLGMRAWGLRVTTLAGNDPDLAHASLRFAAALLSWLALGAGFVWILVDPQRRAWHDHLSRTQIVRQRPADGSGRAVD